MDISGILFDPIGALFSKPSCFLPMILFELFLVLAIVLPLFAGLAAQPFLLGNQPTVSPFSGLYAAVIIIVIIVALLLAPFLNGIYIALASQLRTGSKKLSLDGAVKRAKQKYLSLLGADLLVGAIALVSVGIPYLIFIFQPQLGITGLATVSVSAILILIMIIASIVLLVYFFQVNAAVIIEDKKAIQAFRRSMEIGKKYPWSIIGVILLAIALFLVIDIILGLVVSLISLAFSVLGFAAVTIVSTILSAVIAAGLTAWLYMIAGTFYYSYVAKPASAPAAPAAKPQQK